MRVDIIGRKASLIPICIPSRVSLSHVNTNNHGLGLETQLGSAVVTSYTFMRFQIDSNKYTLLNSRVPIKMVEYYSQPDANE